MCSKGEFISPDKVFDLDHIDSLAHCQGVNPLVNLVNSNVETFKESSEFNEPGSRAPQILATPQSNPPSTPQQPPAVMGTPLGVPAFSINDLSLNLSTPRQSLMETPILNWNTVSTPVTGVGQISGVSLLGLTPDADALRPTGLMPPPLRLLL